MISRGTTPRAAPRFRRIAAAGVLLLFASSLVEAQDSAPEPYAPKEFPQWSRDLRRGEIIAFGSFPIALLVSNIGYDAVRFFRKSLEAGEWNYTYAPWFFGPPEKPPLTQQERVGVLMTAAGVSVGVALIDYVIGRIRADREGS
ncbi:MAG: hypothetical protein ACLFS5_11090 [Spirochaetaceae bacterium]